MISYITNRLLSAIPVVFLVLLITFTLGYFAPGDPIVLIYNENISTMTPEDLVRLRTQYGLDRPYMVQFTEYVGKVARGDLGTSIQTKLPVLDMIKVGLPITLQLGLAAGLFLIVVGIPLGLWAGLRPNALPGRAIMAGSILGFSLPTFWVGLMLIMVFSVMLWMLPSNGRGETVSVLGVPLSFLTLDGLAHLALPATNLALFNVAWLIRLTRSGAREALLQDYVKFARAKGLPDRQVIGVHVLRNILIPIVTVIGLQFGALIAFAIVTESVFAWPGMGKLLIDSINLLDRPVIVAYLLVIVTLFIAINLAVDILYSGLDPRVRLSDGAP